MDDIRCGAVIYNWDTAIPCRGNTKSNLGVVETEEFVMGKYSNIAMALSFNRGIGKTYQSLKFAPKNAVFVCHDLVHMKNLKHEAHILARKDLQFAPLENVYGMSGPFVADHLSISHWLNEAQGEIDHLRKQVESFEEYLELGERNYDK